MMWLLFPIAPTVYAVVRTSGMSARQNSGRVAASTPTVVTVPIIAALVARAVPVFLPLRPQPQVPSLRRRRDRFLRMGLVVIQGGLVCTGSTFGSCCSAAGFYGSDQYQCLDILGWSVAPPPQSIRNSSVKYFALNWTANLPMGHAMLRDT